MELNSQHFTHRIGKGCFRVIDNIVTKCICKGARITWYPKDRGAEIQEVIEYSIVKEDIEEGPKWINEKFVVFTNEELLTKIGL